MREIIKNNFKSLVNKPIYNFQKKFGNNIMDILSKINVNDLDEILSRFEGKKIAVIGNSPNINNLGKGKYIDNNYDIIIRFNRGILNEYLDEENTGLKTNFWVTGALDTTTSLKIRKGIINLNSNIDIISPFPFDSDFVLNLIVLNKFDSFKKFEKFYIPKYFYNDVYIF